MTEVGREEFFRLITSFDRSAFRWECQGVYSEPDEAEPFAAWRAGDPDYGFMDGWLDTVRGWSAAGKTFTRVRMMTTPPTEYLRWMLDFTHLNVEAGEDIQWIDEIVARDLGMPGQDFYLLDDRTVVLMTFDETGVAGATVTEDNAAVAGARGWRDLALANAAPHHLYVTTRSP